MKHFFLLCMSFTLFACSDNDVSNDDYVIIPESALSCSDNITNKNTPADIYPALSECLDKDEFDKGITLLMVAGAYTYFDHQRIDDPSHEEASNTLQMSSLKVVAEDKLMSFMKQMNAFRSDAKSMEGLCAYLNDLGMPSYEPTYLTSGETKKEVDLAVAWKSTLTDYLKCRV